MKKLILASSSPRRKQLMEVAGLVFTIIPSKFKENLDINIAPQELVEYLSFQKAQEISIRHKNAVIIGADTIVVLNNKIIGKPKHKKHAREILKNLSGKTHEVLTGYTIIDAKNQMRKTKVVRSKVYFKTLSNEQIENYIATDEPLDKAGAYGIQGIGKALIEKTEGDYANIVGLPIQTLLADLKLFGIVPEA